ncbi:MAG: hypothetical protein E6I30_08665 [Chloroflexi bacterium]|nr:MAG: hypothetical protein E6I30_08665 [Chloroflexota bacterium]
MAVAMRRPRSTLWMAWVAAGALGTAVAASATQPGFEVFPNLGDRYWLPPALLAAPLALLQFLVLRGAMGVSLAAAGMWVGLTLVASVASLFATSAWYFYVPQVLPRVFIPMETGIDIMFTVADYIPLLLGLAQGIVLAWVFGRRRIAAWWVVANLVAYAVALHLTVFVLTASGFDLRTGGYVVSRVALAASYAAVTGLALVAILRMRAPVAAPRLPRPAV